MNAYQVTTDGYGFSTVLPSDNKFFWSHTSADKFCERRLSEHIMLSLRHYAERAEFVGGYYNTIRKYYALVHINQFIHTSQPGSLPELASQVLKLEADMRAIVPGKKNPHRNAALQEINELVWLCVRVRKQFKPVSI